VVEDLPEIALGLALAATVVGRLWIAVDRRSAVGRRLRRCWRPRRRPMILAILASLAFLAIAEDVVFDEQDGAILRLDRLAHAALADAPIRLAAAAGAVDRATRVALGLVVAGGVLALLATGRRRGAGIVLIGTLSAVGVGEAVRAWSPTRSGFPSVSAIVGVVALGTLLWTVDGEWRRCARAVVFGIAITVAVVAAGLGIASGLHGPSDMLGGLAFGGAWLGVVIGSARSCIDRRAAARRAHATPPPDERPAAARYQAADVAEAYDRRRFHGPGGRYNDWRLRRLLSRVARRLPASAAVLDVPCGTGRIDRWLLARSFRVFATDISPAMLAVARRKLGGPTSGAGFFAADAVRLPLRTASVDAVFCIRFLHLLDAGSRRAALAELARVSRGWVLVEYRRVERPGRTAQRALLRAVTGRPHPPRKMTVDQIAPELQASGLVPERLYFTSRLFSGSILVLARRVAPVG
jgi:SAM-dependent methyltransferase